MIFKECSKNSYIQIVVITALLVSQTDWTGYPIDIRYTIGYCVFVGENLNLWKSTKQTIVSRSSMESEDRAIIDITCELVWIQDSSIDIDFVLKTRWRYIMITDWSFILHKTMFHERTKHIKIDFQMVRKKYNDGIIEPKHVLSANQDLLPLGRSEMQFICNKYICSSLKGSFI